MHCSIWLLYMCPKSTRSRWSFHCPPHPIARRTACGRASGPAGPRGVSRGCSQRGPGILSGVRYRSAAVGRRQFSVRGISGSDLLHFLKSLRLADIFLTKKNNIFGSCTAPQRTVRVQRHCGSCHFWTNSAPCSMDRRRRASARAASGYVSGHGRCTLFHVDSKCLTIQFF
jgi:hypothetical protein